MKSLAKAPHVKGGRGALKGQIFDLCNTTTLNRINKAEQSFTLNNADNGDLKPGEFYLSNETRFIEGYFSEPLTTYAVGWRDPNNIEQTLEFFAPRVQTSERFEYTSWVNAEEFLVDTVNDTDIRGLYSDFKRIEYTGTKVLGKTLNKGLTMRVDLDAVKDVPNWQEMYTGRIMRRLMRNELYRAITLLSAAATNQAKTWSSGSPQPDADVRAANILATTASGVRPTRWGWGDTAWDERTTAYESTNTPGGYAGASRTIDRMASYLNVDSCLVSKERYQSSATGKTEMLGSLVLGFCAMGQAGIEDPSNIKRFVSPTTSYNGQGGGDGTKMGGGFFNVYVQQISAKLLDITVEHHSYLAITSTLGIRQITVS